jgi:phosphatidylglycerol lysyltransferase
MDERIHHHRGKLAGIVAAGRIAPLVRALPVALLLLAAALAVLAAARIPGAQAAVWWTLLPVDPADPDPLILLVTAAAIAALAAGLARGKRAAFLLAVASFGAAIVAQGWLLAHPWGGLVAAACLAILVADRRRYVVRAPREADRLLLALAAAAASMALLGVLAGTADGRLHVGVAQDALLVLQGTAAIVSFSSARAMTPAADGILLVVLVVLARLALAVGAVGILRPPATVRRPLSARARGIVREHGRGGLVPFQLGPEVSAFEPPGLDAVVVHALEGRWAVALGDPVGAAQDAAPAWRRFVDWCTRSDLVPAVYQASEAGLAALSPCRHAFRVGMEAMVDLGSFDLAGSRRANLRHTVTRSRRGGVTTSWWPDGVPPSRSSLRGSIVAVDAAWSAVQAGPVLGFTVGRFDPDDLDRRPIAVATDADGRAVAFASFRPTGAGGWVLELMRRVPCSVPGAFEACLVEAATSLRAAGATELSLGLAPLAGLSMRGGPPEERILAAAARLLRPAYDVAGLEFFKRKFDPRWEPRYLVVRNRADLLGVAVALLRLHLGPHGLRGAATALVRDRRRSVVGPQATPER